MITIVGRRSLGPRLACLSGMLLSLGLVSGCKSQELRPLESAPLKREAAKGSAPVHTEHLRMRVTLNADGTYEREVFHRYRILDKSGVENWGHVYASYSPWYMKPPEIEARVINGSQSSPLDLKVLTQEPAHPSAPDVYGDALVIRGPLPAVRVGSVIEEKIVTRTHRAFLAPNSLHSLVFASAIPKDKVELIVDAPIDMEVKFEVQEVDAKRSEEKKDGRRIVKFEAGPSEALEVPEPMIPSDVAYWPVISFSVGEDWRGLAKRYHDIVEKRLDGVDFKSIVGQVVSPSDSEEQKLAKLHNWVKERVRYIGVEFGDSSVIPYKPDETVSRGFGDCKDQATLLVGLLRAAGFEAHVALLRAGTGQDVLVDLPSLDVFNHAIVAVGGKTRTWIDPTADLLPVGTLPVGDQHRWALIAAKSTDALERIPAASAGDNTYTEERTVLFKEQGEADVVEESRGTGLLDWELRAAFAKSEEDLKEEIKKYVERTYEAEDLGKLTYSDAAAILEPFQVTIEAKKSQKGNTSVLEANAELAESVVMSWVPEALRPSDEDRKSPLFVTAPYQAEVVWEVKPPADFVPHEVPEPVTRRLGKNEFTRKVVTADDGTLTMRTKFTLNDRSLTAKEVQKFRDDYEAWADSRMAYAEYEHRSRKLVREGKVREAVELLQQGARKNASSGLERLRLAETLKPFLFEVAQAEAREAARLDPENPTTQMQVGRFLSSNIVGKDIGQGFDRAGALAAYKRAGELEEDDEIYGKLRYAVMLETHEQGDRYFAPQADLDKAVSVYASLPEKELREFDDGSFRHNRLVTLYYAKRYDELTKELAELPLEEVPANLAVMNAAAVSGNIDSVLKEADRLNLKDEARSSALEAAAQSFSSLRNYRPAERALELAMEASKNPDRLKSRLSMTRKAKQVSVADLPDRTPEQVAIKVLVYSMIADEPDEKFMAKYLSKAVLDKKEDAFVREQLKKYKIDRNAVTIKEEVFGDLFYGVMSATKEGSDPIGYRVKINQETGGQGIRRTMYVIKEGGRYKIRSVLDRSSDMGAEALSAEKAGDTKRAKQWLDWARETFSAYAEKEPLRVLPFAVLYPDANGKKKGDVSMTVAAAALAVESDHAKEAAAQLEIALKKETDESIRQILLHSLHLAYLHLEEYDKSLKVAERLVQALPDSVPAFWRHMDSLWKLKRYGEYEKGIIARLGKKIESERIDLTRRRAAALVADGKIAEGMKVREKLIAAREANADDYNNQAWDGLFVGASDKDLENILRSVEMEETTSRLHTLATVYVELGKVNDAARIMQKLLARRKDNEPDSVDYYILGRLAEHLGYEKVARQHYGKVEKPEKPYTTATYNLAQKRLKTL